MGVLLGRVGFDGQRERVRAVGRGPWEATKFPKAGVWTPLPIRAPPEARLTQKPTPKVGSFGKRWAEVVIMNDPEGRGPFGTPPENRAPGSPDPGAKHISQPMSPLHSWGPDVYRARGHGSLPALSRHPGPGGGNQRAEPEAPWSLQSCAPLPPAAVRAFARQGPAPLHAPRRPPVNPSAGGPGGGGAGPPAQLTLPSPSCPPARRV